MFGIDKNPQDMGYDELCKALQTLAEAITCVPEKMKAEYVMLRRSVMDELCNRNRLRKDT